MSNNEIKLIGKLVKLTNEDKITWYGQHYGGKYIGLFKVGGFPIEIYRMDAMDGGGSYGLSVLGTPIHYAPATAINTSRHLINLHYNKHKIPAGDDCIEGFDAICELFKLASRKLVETILKDTEPSSKDAVLGYIIDELPE